MSWNIVETEHITKQEIVSLIQNEIAAVRIAHYIPRQRCDVALQAIYAYSREYYKNVYPRIGRIGITQSEHKASAVEKLAYFEKAPQAHATRKQVLSASGDLLEDVMGMVGNAWSSGVSLAIEEELQKQYFAGVIRMLDKVLLHYDFAPKNGLAWTIGTIVAQLSWNIYLQVGVSGGQIKIYQKLWEPADDAHSISGSYGYQPHLVEGHNSVQINPEQGDFILLNSRNIHEVNIVDKGGERVTFSSFIGYSGFDAPLTFWS